MLTGLYRYLYCVNRTHLQVRAFYFFATGVLTCTYGRAYGRSTFPFLSNIPYVFGFELELWLGHLYCSLIHEECQHRTATANRSV